MIGLTRKIKLLDRITGDMAELQRKWARLLKYKARVQKIQRWK